MRNLLRFILAVAIICVTVVSCCQGLGWFTEITSEYNYGRGGKDKTHDAIEVSYPQYNPLDDTTDTNY